MICEKCKSSKPDGHNPNLCPKCYSEFIKYLGVRPSKLASFKGTFKTEYRRAPLPSERADMLRRNGELYREQLAGERNFNDEQDLPQRSADKEAAEYL